MILANFKNISLEWENSACLPLGAVLIITAARFGFLRSLSATLLLLASLLLHEFGHIMFAIFSGVKVKALGLSRRGAYIRRECAQGASEILVAAAGPAMNLLLVVLFWNSTGTLGWLAQMNLALFVMNMTPLFGSDGQRILRTIRSLMGGTPDAQLLPAVDARAR